MHNITVIRGDGIGPEVVDATIRVIDATGVRCNWIEVPIGDKAEEACGDPLPARSLSRIRSTGALLKGPLLIKKLGRKVVVNYDDQTQRLYSNVNTALRLELGAFVNVRPVRWMPGISAPVSNLDVVIIRELTEDVYGGYEHRVGADAAEAIKITTRGASARVAEFAFEYARRNRRRRVSAIHKANDLQLTDGLFLRTVAEIATRYSDLEFGDAEVDSCAYNLVTHPEQWDLLLMSNQYGDIISDLCAGLVGSIGIAPGASFGDNIGIFEAAHGTAPDLVGQNRANPVALILSGAMMLDYLGETSAAARIRDAVTVVIREGRTLTPDLGGSARTTAMTNVIIDNL